MADPSTRRQLARRTARIRTWFQPVDMTAHDVGSLRDPDEDRRVREDLARLAAHQMLLASPWHLLSVVLYAAALWPSAHSALLGGAVAVLFVFHVVEAVLASQARRSAARATARGLRWFVVVYSVSAGLYWGGAGLVLEERTETTWTITLVGVAAVAASAVVGSAYSLARFVAFTAPMLVLVIVDLAVHRVDQRWYLVAGMGAFAAVLLSCGLMAHQSFVESIRLRHRNALLAERLAISATHDPLTGLLDRDALFVEAEHESARVAGTGLGYGMVFVDLDRFKAVNDGFGHAVGDRVLVEIADRITASVRGVDLVARFGGDEFVVLVPATDDPRRVGASLAESIRAGIGRPVVVDDVRVPVSASVGFAWSPPGGADPDQLVNEADTAMYDAKQTGRNRTVAFDGALQDRIAERVSLERSLRRAVDDGELVVWAQPVVSLVDRAVHGVELLLRWERPGHGLLLPARFVPAAEASGLVVDIGRFVLTEAARLTRRWAERPATAALQAMVNVSARHLRGGELATDVAALFAHDPALAGRLTVELTETEFAEDTAEAADTLQALVDLGIGVAIDDFGTGYSSLTYLHSLPATAVKVDQRFVQAAGTDAGAGAIVKAVADLCATFGREVVAEGIETLEQAEAVRRLGVPLGQGYQFARPMPLDQVDGWIDAWLADGPATPDLAAR